MGDNNFRFIVTVDNQSRCILTAIEKPDGTIILSLKAAQLARTMGVLIQDPSSDPRHGTLVSEYRYTLHTSLDSKDGVNCFKLHYNFCDGQKKTYVNYNTAIKQRQGFVPLYARRCSHFTDSVYNIKGSKGQDIKIDNIARPNLNGGMFTLVFQVFIGHPSQKFVCKESITYNVRQVNFREFSLVLIWSYLYMPDLPSGYLKHFTTIRQLGPTCGNSPTECVEIFNATRAEFKAEAISCVAQTAEKIEKIKKEYPISMKILLSAPYFKKASVDTEQFKIFSQLFCGVHPDL